MPIWIRRARAADLGFLVDGNARRAAGTEARELDRELLAERVAADLRPDRPPSA